MNTYAKKAIIILKALYKKTVLNPALKEIKPKQIAPAPPPRSLAVKNVEFPAPLRSGGQSFIIMAFSAGSTNPSPKPKRTPRDNKSSK